MVTVAGAKVFLVGTALALTTPAAIRADAVLEFIDNHCASSKITNGLTLSGYGLESGSNSPFAPLPNFCSIHGPTRDVISELVLNFSKPLPHIEVLPPCWKNVPRGDSSDRGDSDSLEGGYDKVAVPTLVETGLSTESDLYPACSVDDPLGRVSFCAKPRGVLVTRKASSVPTVHLGSAPASVLGACLVMPVFPASRGVNRLLFHVLSRFGAREAASGADDPGLKRTAERVRDAFDALRRSQGLVSRIASFTTSSIVVVPGLGKGEDGVEARPLAGLYPHDFRGYRATDYARLLDAYVPMMEVDRIAVPVVLARDEVDKKGAYGLRTLLAHELGHVVVMRSKGLESGVLRPNSDAVEEVINRYQASVWMDARMPVFGRLEAAKMRAKRFAQVFSPRKRGIIDSLCRIDWARAESLFNERTSLFIEGTKRVKCLVGDRNVDEEAAFWIEQLLLMVDPEHPSHRTIATVCKKPGPCGRIYRDSIALYASVLDRACFMTSGEIESLLPQDYEGVTTVAARAKRAVRDLTAPMTDLAEKVSAACFPDVAENGDASDQEGESGSVGGESSSQDGAEGSMDDNVFDDGYNPPQEK